MRKRGNKLRRAISTAYASMLFLMIVFSLLTVIVLSIWDYDRGVQAYALMEEQRMQERITVSATSQAGYVSSVTVTNLGNIDVRIRALYVTDKGKSRFVYDPSSEMDTFIAPKTSLEITLPLPEPYSETAKVVVATERGVKSKEYDVRLVEEPEPVFYNTSILPLGPVILSFDDFYYQPLADGGSLPNDSGPWIKGWEIPDNVSYCAWRLLVMNNDTENRNITINRYSSMSVVSCRTPSSEEYWFLEPTDQDTYTQFLQKGLWQNITFIYSDYKRFPSEGGTNSASKITIPPPTTCMIFLALFGTFDRIGEPSTLYGQTIPFEAAVAII